MKSTWAVVLGLIVVAAGGVLVWSAISTSSARVAATSSADSFFAAGTVELTQPDAAVELLFDAVDLYPGVQLDGCVEIRYDGNVPAWVRMHGAERSGTGLDQYIDLNLTVDPNGSCDSSGPTRQATTAFDARLATLFSRHGSFDDGLLVSPSARAGETYALWATATMVDDNRAQGLASNFSLVIEARP